MPDGTRAICLPRGTARYFSYFNVRCGTIATVLVGWGVAVGGILGVAMHLLLKARGSVLTLGFLVYQGWA